MLSDGGGCMAAATARCRCAWGKFRENLPLLTSRPVPFDLRGRLFSSNVRSSMLHGTETWPMTSAALHRLCRNDRAILAPKLTSHACALWVCSPPSAIAVTPAISQTSICKALGIDSPSQAQMNKHRHKTWSFCLKYCILSMSSKI